MKNDCFNAKQRVAGIILGAVMMLLSHGAWAAVQLELDRDRVTEGDRYGAITADVEHELVQQERRCERDRHPPPLPHERQRCGPDHADRNLGCAGKGPNHRV